MPTIKNITSLQEYLIKEEYLLPKIDDFYEKYGIDIIICKIDGIYIKELENFKGFPLLFWTRKIIIEFIQKYPDTKNQLD